MNNDERFCSIALRLCEGIGHIGAKRLINEMGSAAAVFANRQQLPDLIPGINPQIVDILDNAEAFKRAEKELKFMEEHRITCLTLKDEAYPSRLRECEDAPAALFFRGEMDFNRLHIVSMVGTRRATEYGRQCCAEFVKELAYLCPDVVIVSGLAYGIDIHSHREALANGLTTVAVLAHGLDRIYPQIHRKTAIDMMANGGLLTEYLTETNPDPFNFVERNRIIAGISDATIVVESAIKGGSMITASLTNGYNRDCFAIPGRANDKFSKGCNWLIKENRAGLISCAEDFVKAMGWLEEFKKPETIQRNLFVDLTAEEKQIAEVLQQRGDLQVNTLAVETNIPVYQLNSLLFNMEMKGVVKVLVGGVYHLLA